MSQHTPGPWYATGSSNEGSVYSSEHELIVPWSPLLSDRKMANARLIAAAPDMATWLTAFAADYCPNGAEIAKYRASARAILARIEGQS